MSLAALGMQSLCTIRVERGRSHVGDALVAFRRSLFVRGPSLASLAGGIPVEVNRGGEKLGGPV